MSDSEDEDADEPVVELGDGPVVEGAPLARVASRLTWPIERERLLDREGDAEIRTPDGPRRLAAVLDGVETTYFDTRQTFLEAVRDAVGRGPVPTAGDATDADSPDGTTPPGESAATNDTTPDDDGATRDDTDPAADGTTTDDDADGA